MFLKLNDLHISASVPSCNMKKVPVRRKNTGIVAHTHGTVANVMAALLSYQLPTMLVQFMTTQFPVILLNDLSVPSPNDVFRPRPLRQSAL